MQPVVTNIFAVWKQRFSTQNLDEVGLAASSIFEEVLANVQAEVAQESYEDRRSAPLETEGNKNKAEKISKDSKGLFSSRNAENNKNQDHKAFQNCSQGKKCLI